MNASARPVAIVGVDESDEIGRLPNKSALQLHAEAARNALADAGIGKEEVDGLFTAGISPIAIGEYLGIRPRFTDATAVGGGSFLVHVGHALTAIQAGRCRVALITSGQSSYSRVGQPTVPPDPASPAGQFELPYGIFGPTTTFALAALRHMQQYGTTSEHLAEVAVATRKWAMLHPKALMQTPITVGDVLTSRWICYPFHLLDCCLVTDAGGAVVLTTAERARDTRTRPVPVLGVGEATEHLHISQMADLTTSAASRRAGQQAFAMAGVQPQEIDVAQIYDAFTFLPSVALEDLGFCGPGEGGPFVAGQRTAPGGDFPMNTSGGGLSYTHPGMFGMFLIIEAVRQLRSECGARQVPGARLALCHGLGGVFAAAATLILGAE
ncbi:MAG: thiolase [Chloroflexi bacterium]|nr:thiolase [Chloroflexota bacterium]